MGKVALSGAEGNVGRILRVELPKRGIALRSAGFAPLEPLHAEEDVVHGDLGEPAVVDRLLQGVDTLVHLAGTSLERALPEIVQNNLLALVQVYEGARRHGVRRIVFASSNHAFGMHPVDAKLRLDAEFRPDCFYGLSKMWGEGLARMYWDKHGIEGVALRIGTTMGRPPETARQLSTWMGNEDLVQLVLRAIQAPDVGFAPVWGISANTRAYYDLSEGNAIGYRPTQDAEDWADEVLRRPDTSDANARRFQGGPFVTTDYSRS
ncbi:MAG TPA: NAD(P)-dependent oxidoreductase [Ramlibacter sp.]|nr:NAD(P)-dependent oxidoreductase [Ramlibacter sp.]